MAKQKKERTYRTPLKYGEATRLKAFNLPVSLIESVEKEAKKRTAGNASALLVTILRERYGGGGDG